MFSRVEFKKPNFPFKEVFLTSDSHAYHKNIARGTSTWAKGYRDFNDEVEMTEFLIDKFNRYVKPDDLLIHNGDWSFAGADNIINFRQRLHCKNIILMQGNHDLHINQSYVDNGYFKQYSQIGYFKFGDVELVTCHFPLSQWYHKSKGVYHAFGHVHGCWEQDDWSLDVGVDNALKLLGEYRPFHLEEFISITSKKKIEKLDRR